MTAVQLKWLRCEATNDLVGPDDVFITVNGEPQQSPIQVRAGETLAFGPRMRFPLEHALDLKVLEHDPISEHELLGHFRLGPDTPLGLHTHLLAGPRSRYEFAFEVSAHG